MVFTETVLGQEVKKDTAFTVYSTFIKERKKYPEISIVKLKEYKNVMVKKAIVYKSIDNRNLLLDAFYNTSKLNPAVILIHGGGWKSGSKEHMQPMAAKIASKGYACFAVEYRLSDEATYPAGIIDVKNAIQFIKSNAKKYHIDTTKIAVLGCSSGGQMAALVGTTNGHQKLETTKKGIPSASVQAIIDIDGVLAFKHPESKEGDMASWWLGGTYEEIPEIWNQASALYQTDKNTPPILFINSQYPRFHAGRDDMIKILDEYKIYSEIKNIPNSPHPFWLLHPWFETTTNYIIKFLDRTFK
ncbi:alpha/beta hydrolase [Wenyingzhuangia sp. chi5]|uniref:Alpha/beta hydrolase n=1 Tax=Wenyingzhuangia gilva TaxID=3057677 RepID=A0ABT8VQT9_9FLAO|nr:alpha/beta hydrolase [Wenyingzhuangia sp. chi5]MDO3694329.1 alpha/beta hydrolase [Wenyingzhuangia sp. chi5]